MDRGRGTRSLDFDTKRCGHELINSWQYLQMCPQIQCSSMPLSVESASRCPAVPQWAATNIFTYKLGSASGTQTFPWSVSKSLNNSPLAGRVVLCRVCDVLLMSSEGNSNSVSSREGKRSILSSASVTRPTSPHFPR